MIPESGNRFPEKIMLKKANERSNVDAGRKLKSRMRLICPRP
jgi:hypothetical protein